MLPTSKTQLNAVIGYPLMYSQSPALHTLAYKLLGIDATLLAFSSRNPASLIRAVKTMPIPLVAVTMPYKETIIKYLNEIHEDARAVNAVNTIINRNGVLMGYNTDIVGIRETLAGIEIKGRRVLVLGAGGAGRAVMYVIGKNNGTLFLYNRDAQKARTLSRAFGGNVISEHAMRNEPFDIIINATPVGMYPNHDVTPLANYQFTSRHIVFDLVYSPLQTRLLQEAKLAGAHTISGLDMFLAQALAQITLWTKKTIPHSIQKKLKTFLKNGTCK